MHSSSLHVMHTSKYNSWFGIRILKAFQFQYLQISLSTQISKKCWSMTYSSTMLTMWKLNVLHKKTSASTLYILLNSISGCFCSVNLVLKVTTIMPKYANKCTLKGVSVVDLVQFFLTSSFLWGTCQKSMRLNGCFDKFWLLKS